MKRLFWLPFLLLFSCSQEDVSPLKTADYDFRKGNWYEAKATVLARDVAPASDEGELVIMGFDRRNAYDVYEFKGGKLTGGLVIGGITVEETEKLTKTHGSPVEQGEGYARWQSETERITLFDDNGRSTLYVQPL